MLTRFVEVTNGPQNWGKFMLGCFSPEEWGRRSELPEALGEPLLLGRGWRPSTHLLVHDLQTGEGSFFALGGCARADLEKHKVWVCPMFEPFLEWLYAERRASHGVDMTAWMLALPGRVDLPDAPFAMVGYRRGGHDED